MARYGIVQTTLKNPSLDIKQVEVVRKLINFSEKYQKVFNLDPEPEKPLRIDLNLDQIEELEE